MPPILICALLAIRDHLSGDPGGNSLPFQKGPGQLPYRGFVPWDGKEVHGASVEPTEVRACLLLIRDDLLDLGICLDLVLSHAVGKLCATGNANFTRGNASITTGIFNITTGSVNINGGDADFTGGNVPAPTAFAFRIDE